MKLPLSPPAPDDLLARLLARPDGSERLTQLFRAGLGPAPGGRYRHWDTLRHTPPLAGFTAEEQWLAIRTARQAVARPLPLTDVHGRPFTLSMVSPLFEYLHRVDRDAAGNMGGAYVGTEAITSPATRDTYLFKSIVEEAITSSQLEGASTTRRVAKAMIQEGRPASTRSERMILNNYEAMRYVQTQRAAPLTPDVVLTLQRILTDGALDDASGAGRFRRHDEAIVVSDETGTILHRPPDAAELPRRLDTLCAFANGETPTEFLHPVLRAILVHGALAYDHPFVDGNGRTARALFYWAMARAGYWLCEYVSISRILRKARAAYGRSYLYMESDEHDATYFVLHQLRTLVRAIDDLHTFLQRKAHQLHDVETLVRRAALAGDPLNHRQLALIRHALTTPYAHYTIQSHQRSHGTSYQTARTDLMALAALGLLQQTKRGKAFVYTPADDLSERLRAPR